MKILIQLIMNYSHQLSNVYMYVLFPTSVTFVLLFFILRTSRANIKKKWPPSPSKLPLIGNLHQFGSLPHRKLNTLAKIYGPIMSMQMGYVPAIIVSSSDTAFDILKTQDLSFSSRPHSSMAKLFLYDSDLAFAPYGEYWRQMKKLVTVHLLSNKMARSFHSIREEEVQLMISKIHEKYSELVNLSDLITMLTSDMVCKEALGKKYNAGVGDARKVRYMLHEFVELLGSFPIGDFVPWISWWDSLSGLNSRAKKNFREVDEFLEGVIEEHIQAGKDGDKDHNDEHGNIFNTINSHSSSRFDKFSLHSSSRLLEIVVVKSAAEKISENGEKIVENQVPKLSLRTQIRIQVERQHDAEIYVRLYECRRN